MSGRPPEKRLPNKSLPNKSLPEISPSAVGDLSCSKRYVELRVNGRWPPRKAISAVARGSAFHQAMNALYANRGDAGLDLADLPALAAEAVRRQQWPAGTITDDEIERVRHLMRVYLNSEDPEDVEATVGTETPVGFVYHHCGQPLCYVKSVLDRALVRPEQPDVLVVKEYKTTAQRVELREALILLWCARMKWPGFRYVLEYEFIDAEEAAVAREVVTTDQLRGQLRLLVHSLLRVLHAEPAPQPGPKCQWCHLRAECESLAPVGLGDDEEPFP